MLGEKPIDVFKTIDELPLTQTLYRLKAKGDVPTAHVFVMNGEV